MKLILILPFLLFILITFSVCSTSQPQTIETDPVNVTAQAVLNRYIAAIGGRENFENIKDKITLMRGTAAGKPIDIIIMQKSPNKLYQEITAGEITQTIIFNGMDGVMIAGEEQIKIEDKELERLKYDATLHLPLNPENHGISTGLQSDVEVDSINCYEVIYNLPSGLKWLQYYASESGLKIKEVKEIQTSQGVFQQETYYYDYDGVSGLKFPTRVLQFFGIQELDLKVTSIEINNGLEDEIFEIFE